MDRSADRRAVARQPKPLASRKVTDEELLRETLQGRYRLQGILGQGGMGTVYEAISERTGETVALKVLKAEQVEKRESVERMRHEATVVSRIRHPNICNVHELGSVQEGRPYLVMELLRGETLAKRLEREQRINPTLGVEIAIQALAALDAAHRSGVIHRDMKPDNIFLMSGSGVLAKVLDFGISKATNADDQPHNLTRQGMVMGTPYYMAPEQAMGERQLDARVDVWGVGVLLYEALTGNRPFVAKNYNALLVQILTSNPEPAAVVRPQIPVGLSNAIHRALAKKREDRFASAQEFAKALAPFREDWSPSAQPSKDKAFRQTARSRAIQVAASVVMSDPMTPSPSSSSTPSPASRRTVRMAESMPLHTESAQPRIQSRDSERDAVDSSAAPTFRVQEQQPRPLSEIRRTTPLDPESQAQAHRAIAAARAAHEAANAAAAAHATRDAQGGHAGRGDVGRGDVGRGDVGQGQAVHAQPSQGNAQQVLVGRGQTERPPPAQMANPQRSGDQQHGPGAPRHVTPAQYAQHARGLVAQTSVPRVRPAAGVPAGGSGQAGSQGGPTAGGSLPQGASPGQRLGAPALQSGGSSAQQGGSSAQPGGSGAQPGGSGAHAGRSTIPIPSSREAHQRGQVLGRSLQVGRASSPPSRRRGTEPPKQMASFDTADSSFSVSSSDEEPTQLYDGVPVGDDTPTIEENDLTVVDAPFLEDHERRSR